ncbi:hypothetical protein DM806_23585 [Sphingobium lactosutens]|nr:hypothetical protein [Sphingobium lactosutens]
MLDGPDGVAVSMTPDAAEDTARKLLRAARQAKAQISLHILHERVCLGPIFRRCRPGSFREP